MAITINGNGTVSGITAGLTAAAMPTGSIIQVSAQAYDYTSRTVTSTSYVKLTTDLDVTITPTASNSKILLLGQVSFGMNYSDDSQGFAVFRDSTELKGIAVAAAEHTNNNKVGMTGFSVLDAPGDTSAHTYSIFGKVASGYEIYLNYAPGYGNLVTAGTSLIALEVAG